MTANQFPQPAYLVYYNNLVDPPTRTFFTNSNLLSARRSAMTLAESFFGSGVDCAQDEEVTVSLVEMHCQDDPAPRTIAQVLEKATKPYEETPSTSIDADDKNRKLLALHQEHRYYWEQGHSNGLGAFQISIYEESGDSTPSLQIVTLYDALSYVVALEGLKGWGKREYFDMEFIMPDAPAPEYMIYPDLVSIQTPA